MSRGGQSRQALGRSRGGFLTKIHLKNDLDGNPLAVVLTGGEKSDSKEFATLLDIGPDIDPCAVAADEGYDTKANRALARSRGIAPEGSTEPRPPARPGVRVGVDVRDRAAEGGPELRSCHGRRHRGW